MSFKTTEMAPGIDTGAQVDSASLKEIAAMGYRAIINNRPDNEEPGQMAMADAKAQAEALGLEYHFLPVTSSTIGKQDVEAFDALLERAGKPVLAHCRTGTRVYLLYGATQVLKHGADADAVVAEAAAKGFDIKSLPVLVEKLRSA
ncbi:TIGR01244 family sulfur transferase [Oceanibaculum indicum]|uniref:Sulfide:quinone oxidoreductase n=1 Tax=Oceanibaculum indicum TaxID=526216 RepID=A0A420WA69_9PROT|nr:TIGR01244 family sulfur transferase [Oceanibaculum indicum]RKQ67894.1 sulfide:quinone oxidoreductase [Oceanibaculum indicum]